MSEGKGNGTLDLLREVLGINGPKILRSIYFWAALGITAVCWSLWLDAPWWELSLAVLPSMLGFSLAGFAMVPAFGNDAFRTLLSSAKTKNGHSAFKGYAAIFVLYLGAQVAGLILAILAKADLGVYARAGEGLRLVIASCHFVGFFLVVYGILMALAATLAIYRMARIADELQRDDSE